MKLLRVILLLMVGFSCGERTEVIEDFYEDGSPKIISIYKMVDGESKKVEETNDPYYPDGKKKMHGKLVGSKRDGEWKAWHTNGKIWSVGHYENGMRQGISRIYYESGELYIEGTYRNDEPHGIWKWYEENGQLLKEQDYSK